MTVVTSSYNSHVTHSNGVLGFGGHSLQLLLGSGGTHRNLHHLRGREGGREGGRGGGKEGREEGREGGRKGGEYK